MSFRRRDERGDYSIFVAVVVIGLLVLGGVAYEAPRIMTVRQHALHTAQQASHLAAGMIAGGAEFGDMEAKVRELVEETTPLYGQRLYLIRLDCSGRRIQLTVATAYSNVTVLSLFGHAQRITASAAAEVVLIGPAGQPVPLQYLPTCPFVRVP